MIWPLGLPLFLLRCFHSSHTKNDRLCSTKINVFGLLFWFPFLHIICNLLDSITLSSLGMMFCKFVLIFKFRTQSFNTLPSGSLIDKNLFLQTLPIFYETTKLFLIKWISSKPQHPWSQKRRSVCLQWKAVSLICTNSSSEQDCGVTWPSLKCSKVSPLGSLEIALRHSSSWRFQVCLSRNRRQSLTFVDANHTPAQENRLY